MRRFGMVVLGVVLVLGVCVGVSATADAATYYVSPNGRDTLGNGSEGDPWKTIGKAVTHASAGDMIRVVAGTDDSDDYVENVVVDKRLWIEEVGTVAKPQIKASVADSSVFSVTADSVVIKGLAIYGAFDPTWQKSPAGIYLKEVTGCTIRENRCGWDADHKNNYGIYLGSSSANTVSDNTCSYNDDGIRLYSSRDNTVSGNTCSSNNDDGIVLNSSSNANTVSANTCSDNNYGIRLYSSRDNTVSGNTCSSNNSNGIVLYSSSNANTVSGNTCSNNSNTGIVLNSSSNANTVSGNTCNSNNNYGIYLGSSRDNTVSDNTCSYNSEAGILLVSSSNANTVSDNTCSNNNFGIWLGSSSANTVSDNTCSYNSEAGIRLLSSSNGNTIYLNSFSNTTTNVSSEGGSTNLWRSPMKVCYVYGTPPQTYKSYVGNHYSDHTTPDANGNGIVDSAKDLPGNEPDDTYPLVTTLDKDALQVWYLANPVLAQGDMSKPGGTVSIAASDSVVWVAEQAESSDRVFSAGDASDSTSWTGQVTFTSAPGGFTVEVGSADGDGSTFQPGGPEKTLAGTDTTVFTYVTNAAGFTVPVGKHLALKITNTSASSDTVRVGGAWSYCASPVAGAAPPVRITVSVPEWASVPKDGWHKVPVFVSEDLTGEGFTAFQTVLTYDGSVIHPEDVLTEGTMTEGWAVEFNVLPGASPDTFKIAMSTAEDTLKGAGTLFYIHVKAAEGASVGDQTTLHFERFRFNEDADADTRDGTVYIVEPPRLLGDVTDNGDVTAFDAAWVLQHTVTLRVLAGGDSVAADVSGRMGISAYDASLILQYVVGKITEFPADTGAVDDPTPKLASLRTLSLGAAASGPAGRSIVPILIDEMAGVVAGEMTLSFSGEMGDVTVRTSDLTSDYLLAHNVEDGRIRLSFAGAESSTGSGSVLEILLDAPDADLLRSLRLDRVVLNEGMIPARIEAKDAETPGAYRLAQNCPNPFNPETVIRYDLPKAGAVRLSIYALTGQVVRTLVDGERPVGRYSVAWDGRDNAGRDVASGVYLYRMDAGDFRGVRKLVLVR